MYLGKASEARLQTATSSAEVYSIISVHRFELLMVPKFCWFDLPLAVSLYSRYGVPVSTCASSTANHKSCAFTVLRARPSLSYCVYKASNSAPKQSARPGASCGQNRLQSSLASTLFINRSDTQRA